MRRRRVVLSTTLAAAAALAPLSPAGAEPLDRPRLVVAEEGACAGIAGRFVAWLEPGRGALVLSGAPFPGGELAGRASDGVFATTLHGFPVHLAVEAVPGAGERGGEVWALYDRADAGRGCLAFDKERFTWASDLLTYVRYLARLLGEAQKLDPARTALVAGERIVRLEVERPGVDRASLEGPEGAMLGYGSMTAPERFVFVPVPLGASADAVLLRVLRSEGEAFGGAPMQHLGWTLVPSGSAITTPTDPPFVVKLVAVEPAS